MWLAMCRDLPIPDEELSRSTEDRRHEMGRAAALEQADRVEQLDIEMARDHERVAGWAAVPGETFEPGAQKLLSLGRLEQLELCRSHRGSPLIAAYLQDLSLPAPRVGGHHPSEGIFVPRWSEHQG